MQPRLELFSTTDTKHFLDRLRRLVMDEATTARFAIERIWSKPIPTRVAEGHAIEGVRVQYLDQDGYLHLTCDRNLSRFREGDILLPLLMGNLRPTMDVPHYERGLALGESFGLNWSQTEALAQA